MSHHKLAMAVAAVTLLGVTGCDDPISPPSFVASAHPVVGVVTECRDIDNAYTLWRNKATLTIRTAIDLQLADEGTFAGWMQQGKAFMDVAEGHADQASKDLALSVAIYNYQLASLNLDRSKFKEVTAQAAAKAFESYQNIHYVYQYFQASTCTNTP